MGQKGLSAREVVNEFDEKKLADILFTYGEERASRRIASHIVKARQKKEINTTGELAELIHQVMPKPKDGSDSAMRSFQALRIFVNDELGELERALEASKHLLKVGGRLVVVTFHSLEDRIVKNVFKNNSVDCICPPKIPICICNHKAKISIITKKPITASLEEINNNSRSTCAKLRIAEKK